MATDAWLPRGFDIESGGSLREVVDEGVEWQIYTTTSAGARILLARPSLASRWAQAGLLPDGALHSVTFGDDSFALIQSEKQHRLVSLARGSSPNSLSEAMAFAKSLQRTRARVPDVPLQDAIYVERYSTLLPTYSVSASQGDDVVLGAYLSGGVQVSCRSSRRLTSIVSWLPNAQLAAVVKAAGIEADVANDASSAGSTAKNRGEFKLPGRPALEALFKEHVIDIVEHRDRYKAMGIESPSAIVLYGPPGCGKTFAVERLVEYLGWPMFQIASGTVGSPFIHETGKKISEVFAKALDQAPSVVLIDEMESFLSDRVRGADSGQHRVEEVAEFLRRIPEAVKGGVLVIGMTNRLEMIDPAILRRGRFDHVVEVTMPTREEVRALLDSLLAGLPTADNVRPDVLADRLTQRPLSDVAFVIREAGRLAARTGKDRLDEEMLELAVTMAPPRDTDGASRNRIGFA